MKVICIGRNYSEHAKEMKSEVPTEPVFFMKPDTAVVKDGGPFYMPDFSTEIHHEIELVVRISKAGKNIGEEFAHKYYEEITVGIDFTARDLQAKCKEKGLPWEKAKAFDGSAPIGSFVKVESGKRKPEMFSLRRNGKMVQSGSTADMIFSVDKIIAYVSKFVTLKVGDLIFTGTPEGVGPVKEGDLLEGFLGEQKLLTCEVR